MAIARSGGRVPFDALAALGCDRIFCVPGESYLVALDALVDVPAIEPIVARRESAAARIPEDGARASAVALDPGQCVAALRAMPR